MSAVVVNVITPIRVLVFDSWKLETIFLAKVRIACSEPCMLQELSMTRMTSAGHCVTAEQNNTLLLPKQIEQQDVQLGIVALFYE